MERHDFDEWDEQRKRRREERETRRAERRQASGEENPASPREGRKEKVLHTRISEHLDDALRNAAGELRVPVSNLVRNVLEDVFDVVETVTENVEELVEDLMEEASHVRERFGRRRRVHGEARPRPARPRPVDVDVNVDVDRDAARQSAVPAEDRPEFPDVLGWQPLVLNAEQRCADCGRDLIRGDRAVMGVGPSPAVWLCPECLDARR